MKFYFIILNNAESLTSLSSNVLVGVMTHASGSCQLCAVYLCVKMACTTPDVGQNPTVITVWMADR